MSWSIRRAASVALVALTFVAAGCDKNPTAPSVPFTQTDIVVGTGAEATRGKVALVNYTGWLYSSSAGDNKGTQFDTSIGKVPLAFTVGLGQVIQGWDQGVPGMRVGGKRRLVIPAELGYGPTGAGSIPGNATLLFEIELLGVQGQ